MNEPHFLYPLISWWTFKLFILSGCCEWCCKEDSCIHFCVNIHFQFSWKFSYLGVRLLCHMIIPHLNFWGIARWCSMVSHHFTFIPALCKGSKFCTSSLTWYHSCFNIDFEWIMNSHYSKIKIWKWICWHISFWPKSPSNHEVSLAPTGNPFC